MKTLHAIRLVQFYLFEKEDLPIRKISGVFGPNGSGKSALIDALQIVMTGANLRFAAFNAQADETGSTSRSLRSYCLGQTGESEKSRVRDAATTYLTLIWKDDDSGEPTSMGLCITANSNTDKHHVEGRYLLPGVELALDDHLEASGGNQRPLDWKTFRSELERQARAVGYEDEIVFNDSQRFVRAYLTALRGSGAIPQPESFLRAFRFGLKMRFDKPVDEIIRYQMLESRPTPVEHFRKVMESVRDLHQRVLEVEGKINEAEKVVGSYNQASKLATDIATSKAVAGKAHLLDLERTVESARKRLTEAEKHLATLTSKQDNITRLTEQAEAQKAHYADLVQQHSAYKEIRNLQQLIDATKKTLDSAQAQAARQIGQLRACLRIVVDHPELIPKPTGAEGLHDDLIELLNGDAPLEKERVEALCENALTLVVEAKPRVDSEQALHQRALSDLQDQRQTLTDNLQRLKAGKPPLPPHVLRLQHLLQDNGIACTPICDLVSVSDASWQPAIEAYLNVHLQGLLVENHEERAFDLYRSENIHGAKIVRASRNRPSKTPAKGTIAALLEGDHLAAVEYLRSQLGATLCADTNESALAGERTLTRDGMLTGKTIDRLRCVQPHAFLLGIENRTAQRDGLIEKAMRLDQKIQQKQKQADRWHGYRDRFSQVAYPNEFRASLSNDLTEAHNASEQLELYNRKATDTADSGLQNLRNQQSEWTEKLKGLREDSNALLEELGSTKTTVTSSRDNLSSAQARHTDQATRYAALTEAPDYDPSAADAQWFELADMQKLDLMRINQEAEQHVSKAHESQQKAIQRGRADFANFTTRYSLTQPDEVENWVTLRAWLIKYIEQLHSSELANYRSQMDDAFKASQETFRNDVALAIESNIDWLRTVMDRLNKVLANAPAFSNGEYYRFIRTTRPEHNELLGFIKRVRELGPQDDMFGAGEMPEAFRNLLEESTGTGARARGPLDDYREFFDFDIEIYRRDANNNSVTQGRLSRRIGTGSGGEHRAPLYVIAGAALASAYHLSPIHQDGLALIALDEAFNKMDPGNIISTMQYFNDLGLQVVMASPGENLGTLTAFLHGYFDIIREADLNVVLLDHHEVPEATRELFQQDLLEFHPELLDQKLKEMQGAVEEADS